MAKSKDVLARDVPLAEERLHSLQQETFNYFWKEGNPENGLLPDNTLKAGDPASIAGVGLALTTYVVGVERSLVDRARALERTLATLRFFWNSRQADAPDATGYRGFYYHFLDVKTGRRAWKSELSTIDTAILLAGALSAAEYFNRKVPAEQEVRDLAERLYLRTDWQWAQNDGMKVSHGWTPERGFLPYLWEGYCEGLLLYVLGLGSPTFPLPGESFDAWTSTYRWIRLYGHEFVYGGPLFMHQLSHLWMDFRGIQDAFMRDKCIDYFENSRRATYVQQAYAIRNPKRFVDYGEYAWGLTASNGPGPVTRRINGMTRRFLGYRARGVPYGPDDGTLAPWAVVASLPFAPEIVLPTVLHALTKFPKADSPYGLVCSVNPTFRKSAQRKQAWISDAHFALDQGPVIIMIENYRSGLIWRLMRGSDPIVRGLRRAGFTGGWLGGTR
jgi:hypothetical protein